VFGLKKRRRQRLAMKEFPIEWLIVLTQCLPLYRLLSEEQQCELRGLIQVFLAEKRFEGCNGLVLTDEIRVTIAAQACLLLIGRETDNYPKLRSVLVYPHAYVAPVHLRQPDGTVTEGHQGRQGESWTQGYVVLSWEDVVRGGGAREGRNVVLHEFAHQLDSESGAPEGAPLLAEVSMYSEWARVFGAEYQALRERVERNQPALLDAYGAVSPAEFFAVATEYFFELPIELETAHPELYRQLKLYYGQDPAMLIAKIR
jgi:Mlc titration factor MtfA (ptsG expression regulator)